MQPQREIYFVTLLNGKSSDSFLDTAFFSKHSAIAFALDKKHLFGYADYKLTTLFIGDADKNPAYQLWELIKQAKVEED